VLVTGATGFLGMAVTSALVSRGHHVSRTVRDPARAAGLSAVGVTAVAADIRGVARLAELASGADRVVHCAFAASGPNDDLAVAIDLERHATDALLRSTQRPGSVLVYTSGIGVLADADDDVLPRTQCRDLALPCAGAMTSRRLVADSGGCVVRPALVYGHGGNALIVDLIKDSLARGAAGHLGDGRGALPTVHLDDLADVYVRIVEASEPGTTFTVVGETTTSREVARAIGRLIGRPDATGPLAAEVVARELPTAQWISWGPGVFSRWRW